MHESHKLYLKFTSLTPSAVFLQCISCLRRTLPSHTTPPPRLAPGSHHGTQDPCHLATVPPPLLRQRDPLRRNPHLGSPVSLTALCGEREPTVGLTKTLIVSLLLIQLLLFLRLLLFCHMSRILKHLWKTFWKKMTIWWSVISPSAWILMTVRVLLLLTDYCVCFLSHRESMRPEQTLQRSGARKEEAVQPGAYMQCK